MKPVSPVPLKQVESKAIKAFGYMPEKKTLIVEFHSGDLFAYANVSAKEHAALEGAESIGKWFAKHIRANAKLHPVRKL